MTTEWIPYADAFRTLALRLEPEAEDLMIAMEIADTLLLAKLANGHLAAQAERFSWVIEDETGVCDMGASTTDGRMPHEFWYHYRNVDSSTRPIMKLVTLPQIRPDFRHAQRSWSDFEFIEDELEGKAVRMTGKAYGVSLKSEQLPGMLLAAPIKSQRRPAHRPTGASRYRVVDARAVDLATEFVHLNKSIPAAVALAIEALRGEFGELLRHGDPNQRIEKKVRKAMG